MSQACFCNWSACPIRKTQGEVTLPLAFQEKPVGYVGRSQGLERLAWHRWTILCFTIFDRVYSHNLIRSVLELMEKEYGALVVWDTMTGLHMPAHSWAIPDYIRVVAVPPKKPIEELVKELP